MARSIAVWAALLSAPLLQASAQLLSCAAIDCPMSAGGSTQCAFDNTTLTQLGVANFSSSLSSTPLTWTVGFASKFYTDSTDQRRYYLGTPPDLDLSTRTDITGCALFFTGIESSLSFPGMFEYQKIVHDTCNDALGSTCVTDLTDQALNLLANSTNAQCSELAQALQTSPPLSCTKAGTWGDITAKTITGSNLPAVIQRDDCNPTTSADYDLRNIATFPRLGGERFVSIITPLMTIFAANGNETDEVASPEVHLNCMMPMENYEAGVNTSFIEGGGQALAVWKSFPSMTVALVGFLAVAVSVL